MDALRRAVISLAKATGWGLAEIMGMDDTEDDFWAWLASAEMVENEIAEAMKQA